MQAPSPSWSQTGDSWWRTMFVLTSHWGVSEQRCHWGEEQADIALGGTKRRRQAEGAALRAVCAASEKWAYRKHKVSSLLRGSCWEYYGLQVSKGRSASSANRAGYSNKLIASPSPRLEATISQGLLITESMKAALQQSSLPFSWVFLPW